MFANPPNPEPQPTSQKAIKTQGFRTPPARSPEQMLQKHSPGCILACPGHAKPHKMLLKHMVFADLQHPAPSKCYRNTALAAFWLAPGTPSPTECYENICFRTLPAPDPTQVLQKTQPRLHLGLPRAHQAHTTPSKYTQLCLQESVRQESVNLSTEHEVRRQRGMDTENK